MDSQLFDTLQDMRREATERHIEVVQRLTALETSQAPIEEIEDRVKSLEGWRAKAAGITIGLNMAFAGVMAYIEKHR